MPNFEDQQYSEIITEQAKFFNKRIGWVKEMEGNPAYKEISFTSGLKSDITGDELDLRDLFSMSSLLPLRGATEEEQKKNLQEDVFKMGKALLKGPAEEAYKYIDMLIDIVMNYDESKFDFSKKEDVFKIISYASLGQCLGQKKAEFKSYYNKKFNSKQDKEKFYYANAATNSKLDRILRIVNEKVKLDLVVTLFQVGEPIYDENKQNILDRDEEQYNNILQNKEDVVPFKYLLSKELGIANAEDPNIKNTVNKIMGSPAISLNTDIIFQDVIMPGGTEGKPEIELYGFTYRDCIFINGVPLEEAVKGSRFDDPTIPVGRKMTSFLVSELTNPTSMIEVCKLVPVGGGEFKKQFIQVHKDFSKLEPDLQKTYDENFKKYSEEGYKENRENEVKHIDKVFDRIRTKEAQKLLEKASEIPDIADVCHRPNYKDYDDYFDKSQTVTDELTRLKSMLNISNKYLKLLGPEKNLTKLSIIELRQAAFMAMIMAGKNATEEDIYKERIRLHKAYETGGEVKKEYNRSFIKKLSTYDPTAADFTKKGDLYEYLCFVLGSSGLANIFEEDHDLENEFIGNPVMKNKIALLGNYTMGATDFLGSKIIERMGSLPGNSFTKADFDNYGLSDSYFLSTPEAKRMLFDVTNAKINCVFKDESEHVLTIPYFMAGNACGSHGDHYSVNSANATFDTYLDLFSVNDGETVTPHDTMEDANINTLAVSAAHSLLTSVGYVYQTRDKDNIGEIASTMGLDQAEMAERCTYINGKSLKELIDGKFDEVAAAKGIDKNDMPKRLKNDVRAFIADCFMAEALAKPDKSITQVFFKSDENNKIEIRTVQMKKDYTAFGKQLYTQHGFGEKVLHFFHIRKYQEEIIAERNQRTIQEYNTNNTGAAIAESFKKDNNEMLMKHQYKFAKTDELKLEAYKALGLDKQAFKSIKEEFTNEKVEANEVTEDAELSNRPSIEKDISNISRQMADIHINDKKYADDLEEENFNRKFEKKEQVEIDVQSENESEMENIAENSNDSSIVSEDEKDLESN